MSKTTLYGTGLETGNLDHHGELELILFVGGKRGSVFISREFWEAVGAQFKAKPKPKRRCTRKPQGLG